MHCQGTCTKGNQCQRPEKHVNLAEKAAEAAAKKAAAEKAKKEKGCAQDAILFTYSHYDAGEPLNFSKSFFGMESQKCKSENAKAAQDQISFHLLLGE